MFEQRISYCIDVLVDQSLHVIGFLIKAQVVSRQDLSEFFYLSDIYIYRILTQRKKKFFFTNIQVIHVIR